MLSRIDESRPARPRAKGENALRQNLTLNLLQL